MANERAEALTERDEIEALLPWYVSGKLEAKSRARVERYLEAHPEVKAHLALVREEADATVASNEAIAAPGPRALDRLRASIAPTSRRGAFDGRADATLQSLHRLARRACAAAARACRGGGRAHRHATGRGHRRFDDGARHRTCLSNGRRRGDGGEGFALLVGFSAGATIGEINDLLKRLDAVVTDGPKAGLYRLRVPRSKAGNEEAAIEALKQSGIVATVPPER